MHFKDQTGGLHFLSDADLAYGAMALLPAGSVEITDAEAESIRAAAAQVQPNPRIEEIRARLTQIDVDSVRPLRAVAAGTATDFDRDKLAALDVEADALRTELSILWYTA